MAFQALRTEIARIEASGRAPGGVLPFGVDTLDDHLPAGGLQLGALHEVAGGGNGALHGAASALFVAGIAARTQGQVLWCVTRPDLFAPALQQAGLDANRIIYVEAGDETAVLAAFEEGLRHGGLGAVVGEVARLSMTASRRLQLAAEESRTLALAIRRWRRQAEARRIRPAHRRDDALAGYRPAVEPPAGRGRRPGPVVRRTDPLPRRGLCGFRTGSL